MVAFLLGIAAGAAARLGRVFRRRSAALSGGLSHASIRRESRPCMSKSFPIRMEIPVTVLFAHHLEPEHVLVMSALFLAGGWIGWGVTSFMIHKNDGKVRPSV